MKAQTLPSLESSNHLVDEFLSSGSVHYVYQPVVDATSSEVVANEVFMRHLRGARSSVLLFLPMSPQHRFRLDLHGVGEIAKVLGSPLCSARHYMLNIDAETLLSPNFSNEVKRLLMPEQAKYVSFEITSRSTIDPENEDVIYNISSLADYGLRIGIDGMGTKSSNLPLISMGSISFIKLDSWISDKIEDPRISLLASNMAKFAKEAGLTIFAKDIESKKQSDILLSCGIHRQQGNYFGQPDFVNESKDNKH